MHSLATAPLPELNIRVAIRRWVCVLDPALALSSEGILLARHLGPRVQLWVVRQLWHILDSSAFYLGRPAALSRDGEFLPGVDRAIADWERLRVESDLGGMEIFWIGDGPAECRWPEGESTALLRGYEGLARALDAGRRTRSDAMSEAAQHAVALAAALGNACILCRCSEETQAPMLLTHLADERFVFQRLDEDDRLVARERAHFCDLMAHAGLAPILWSGTRLAVARCLLPDAVVLPVPKEAEHEESAWSATGDGERPAPQGDPWRSARLFWYPL